MAGIVKLAFFPESNPYRWIEDASDKKHLQTLRPDDFFTNQIPFWKQKTNYFEKVTFWSYMAVQVQVGGRYLGTEAGEHYMDNNIYIYDCNHKIRGIVPVTSSTFLPGNIRKYNGVDYSLVSLNFKFALFKYNILEPGIYYLKLSLKHVVGGNTFYDYYTSEPLHVAAEHPFCRRFEYISFSNKLHVDYTDIFFHKYIEANLDIDEVGNVASGYDDQHNNPRQQSNIPYTDVALSIGYPYGVPNYQLQKLNNILANDYVIIDGVRYVKPKENKIEKTFKNTQYEQYGAKVNIREYDSSEATLSVTIQPLVLFDAPAYPYMIQALRVKNSISNAQKDVWIGFEINNAQQEQEFLTILNGFRKQDIGMTGTFSKVGSEFLYANGPNENWDTTLSVIWTKYINLSYAKPAPGTPITLGLTISGKHVAVVPQFNSEVQCYGDGVTNQVWNITYDYAAKGNPGTATVRVWHNDLLQYISIVDTQAFTRYNPPSVAMHPVGLEQLFFHNTGVDTINMDLIAGTLQYFTLRNANIPAGGVPLFQNFGNKSWPGLKYFDVQNNGYSTAQVDFLFIAHQTVSPSSIPVNGLWDIRGNAAPSAASLSQRLHLANTKNWVVRHA